MDDATHLRLSQLALEASIDPANNMAVYLEAYAAAKAAERLHSACTECNTAYAIPSPEAVCYVCKFGWA